MNPVPAGTRRRPPGAPIRVMLVDDSAIIRRLLGGVLDTDAAITIAGNAVHGQDALDRLDEIDPDVVVLDIEMPVMDGLTTLGHLSPAALVCRSSCSPR